MAPALLIAATAMTAGSQIMAARHADAMGKNNQAIMDYNAKVDEQNAQAVEQQTMYEQKQQAENADRSLSSMRAGLGASGAVTTEGSPLEVMAKQASEFEQDNLMTGYEGRTRANQWRNQATADTMTGRMYRIAGKNARNAGYMAAGGTLLTGFGKSGAFDKPTTATPSFAGARTAANSWVNS